MKKTKLALLFVLLSTVVVAAVAACCKSFSPNDYIGD